MKKLILPVLVGLIVSATVYGVVSTQYSMTQFSSNGVVTNVSTASPLPVTGIGPSGSVTAEIINPASSPIPIYAPSPIPITGSISVTNPSVGPTASPVPTSANYVGFRDQSGNLQGVTLTAAGELPVAIASPIPLPIDAATSALQVTGNSVLGSILLDLTNGTQITQVSNFPSPTPTQTVTGTVNIGTFPSPLPITFPSPYPTVPVTGSVTVTNFPSPTPTQPVILASPIPAGNALIGSVQDKAAISVTGSSTTGTVSTVITLTAPANAVGFQLMNLDTSSTNIRWALGATASATVGSQLEPGRDSNFIPYGGNISVCSESGTNGYQINWVSQ